MLVAAPYVEQLKLWPATGRHILAQYDADTIVVYQAYRHSIADYAVAEQRFGGDFRLTRMSWIKPNFLWMMYRSNWASKAGQERVLAVRLQRQFFERLLAAAVPSTFSPDLYQTREAWQDAVAGSDVRVQWDPDHDPRGVPLERRALQLGLRATPLREYATDAIVEIEDITSFVRAEHVNAAPPYSRLKTPLERVFTPSDSAVACALGLANDNEKPREKGLT
jgi:hypothetical protein